MTRACVFLDQLESYSGMTLAKIPLILLATWGINTSYRPPNSPPPQHERFSSSAPLENFGFVKWGPIIGRVSNYSYIHTSQKKTYQTNPRIGHTIHCWRCWDINHPGICESFIASIQTNIVAACLERWKDRKPSHNKNRCNRIDYNSFGNMDKGDDLPSPGTIFPVRGQYSEGARAYRLRSILCRSSSELHGLDFDIWWIVPLVSERRVLDYGVGVVEHDVGEIARRNILQRTQHLCLHFYTGKNVEGRHGA